MSEAKLDTVHSNSLDYGTVIKWTENTKSRQQVNVPSALRASSLASPGSTIIIQHRTTTRRSLPSFQQTRLVQHIGCKSTRQATFIHNQKHLFQTPCFGPLQMQMRIECSMLSIFRSLGLPICIAACMCRHNSLVGIQARHVNATVLFARTSNIHVGL